MGNLILELDGLPVPMPDDAELALTFKANDVRNMGTRDGAYAETFSLPDTNATRRILGNSQFVNSATDTPYRLIPAVLKYRGNAVLTGTAGHTDVADGFAIDLDGQNAELFARIKDRHLRELDLSDLDHNWTNDNVAAANSHNPARGYTYPLINYGRLTERELVTGNTRFDELYPAVYVSELLKRICAPYTLSGSLLEDERFKRMVVPFTNKYFQYRQSYAAQYYAKARSSSSVRYLSGYEENPIAPLQTFYPVTFHLVDSDSKGLLNITRQFVVPFAGNYDINAHLTVSTQIPAGNTGGTDIRVGVVRSGDSEINTFVTVQDGPGQAISISTVAYNLNAGDTITIIIAPYIESTQTYVHENATFEVSLQNAVYPGRPVHLDANLPDVSQEELLLTIFNLFNVLIQTNPVSGTVRLDLLEGIRLQQPVDWSRKIDWQTLPRHTFALDGYGQKNYIGYAENEATDLSGSQLIDRMEIPVANERLDLTEELFTSAFTFTQMRPAYRGAAALPYIPLYNQAVLKFSLWNPDTYYAPEDWVFWGGNYWSANFANNATGPAKNSPAWMLQFGPRVFEPIGDATPRLLIVEERQQPIHVGEDYQLGSTYPLYTQGTFTGLESATLQGAYHGITATMLQQTRLLRLEMRLNVSDITGLDFLRPVLLNVPQRNLAGMFYLNAVNQWNPDMVSCEVELVRLFGLPMKAGSVPVSLHYEFSDEFSEEFA